MEKKYYYLAGFFFLFLQIVAIVRNFYLDFVFFFWFCDFVCIFYAIGFFTKNDYLIKGIVNIGLIPQVIYFFSFLVRAILGVTVINEMDILFSRSIALIFMTLFFHLATIFAFLFTYKIRPERRDLFYSFGFLTLMWLVAILFTSPQENINYAFLITNYFEINSIFSFLEIPLAFLVLVIPTHFFRKFVWKKFRKN